MNYFIKLITLEGSVQDLLMLSMVFVVTVGAVMAGCLWLFADPAGRRLSLLARSGPLVSPAAADSGEFHTRIVEPVAKFILPSEDWRRSQIRYRLVRAGFRDPRSTYVYLAAKLILAMALPLVVAAVVLFTGVVLKHTMASLLILCVAALVGYLLPNVYLAHCIEERQQQISDSFPDALDMLVVCVEAGLSLDAAIQRVGQEFKHSHVVLAAELDQVSLELRAGMPRDEALRGLADRTGVEDIRTITSILVQAQQFGTSIAHSLREQANDLRLIRMQRAKEKAAKLPVKLIFPVLVFIFPAMYLVILGPAFIRIHSVLGTLPHH